MIEDLIKNLIVYKTSKAFEGYDFEVDLITLYGDIRKEMAESYRDFGPMAVDRFDTDLMTENELLSYKKVVDDQERKIKDGYNRVKVKVKELRRGYKNAVDAGTRSGSGKIVKEHFDELQKI